MPWATIRGAQIQYDFVGSSGPWCVLTPGGRYDLDENRALAESLAAGGYRVVLHDRRNIGASDVGIGPEERIVARSGCEDNRRPGADVV